MVIFFTTQKTSLPYNFMFQQEEVEELVNRLEKEEFIKKVRVCHIQELETPFVGNLYQTRKKTLSLKVRNVLTIF